VRWFIFFDPRSSEINSTLPSRPGGALRHREVADCPEVADSGIGRTCPQKTADIDGLRYSEKEELRRDGAWTAKRRKDGKKPSSESAKSTKSKGTKSPAVGGKAAQVATDHPAN